MALWAQTQIQLPVHFRLLPGNASNADASQTLDRTVPMDAGAYVFYLVVVSISYFNDFSSFFQLLPVTFPKTFQELPETAQA